MNARLITPVHAQWLARAVLWTMMAAALAILALILMFVLGRGLPHLSWAFLSQAPGHSGRTGGIWPIVVGTLQVTRLGVALAAPLGVGTAIPDCRIDGTVEVAGESIYAPGTDIHALRKRVGMVFQRPNPFPLSVFEM